MRMLTNVMLFAALVVAGCGTATDLSDCEHSAAVALVGSDEGRVEYWNALLDSVAAAAPADSTIEVLVRFAQDHMSDADITEVWQHGIQVTYRFNFLPAVAGLVTITDALRVAELERVAYVAVSLNEGAVQLGCRGNGDL
ncbi:MAG TPA: hypothetical protein VGA37_07050 [Gemmatimonadales bacterium]